MVMPKETPAGTPATTNDDKPADIPANAPDTQTPATPDPQTPATPDTKPLTQADIDAAVKKAQKQWQQEKTKADETAKLSEDERIKAENADLKREIQMNKAEVSVLKELEKAGAKSPKLLFNVKKGELQFDDKGNLTNLADVIDELKADYADQFTVEKPDESIDAGAGTTKTPSGLTKELISKMSPAEINQRWDEIQKFLNSQK